jgi:hypothetical protein
MNETQFDHELEQNKRSYKEQRDRIRKEYAGKYVGFAFGRVIAVGDDYDAVTTAMNALDPSPACSLVFPAELEPLFDPPMHYDTYSEFVD